jgi:hypothetical protein
MAYEAKNFYDFITDYDKNLPKYFAINEKISEVNKLLFEVKNICKIP